MNYRGLPCIPVGLLFNRLNEMDVKFLKRSMCKYFNSFDHSYFFSIFLFFKLLFSYFFALFYPFFSCKRAGWYAHVMTLFT